MSEGISVLDDIAYMKRIDSMNMLDQIWSLPEQCERAWELGMSAALAPAGEVRQVVVTGLGGSAIGGDLLRVYAQGRLGIPVIVNRDYVLPAFVGENTLVLAVSYSGNTEETVSAYRQARSGGASIIVVTTGGRLKEMAAGDGVPVVEVPAGLSPRAATGYLFVPALAVLQRLGLLRGVEEELAGLGACLRSLREKLGPQVPAAGNPAKQMAARLLGRLPVIWGAGSVSEAVAQRWKGQFNENAKAPAYWNVFPELNHNEIVGFEAPGELGRLMHVIILRHPGDHPRVRARMELTRRIVEEAGAAAAVEEVHASGEGFLANTYSLIMTGDYASVYLAFLKGVDPGPVKTIDRLKAELANIWYNN